MSNENELPHWDLTPYYPSLTSETFKAAYQQVLTQIGALTERFDLYQIGSTTDTVGTDETVQIYEELAQAFDTLELVNNLVSSYVYAHISTDTTNELAQGIASELRGQSVALQTLAVRWVAWLGSIDTDTLKAKSELASLYAYPLEQAKVGAQHQMSSPEEELAAQLSLSGTAAWGRLHSDMTSQLTVAVGDQKLPMAMVRVLSSDADAKARRDAYDAELATWPTVALPLAAAMNGIKHETNVLATRRGWADPLDEAVAGTRVDRALAEVLPA
jgi:oligoendopeptidase F